MKKLITGALCAALFACAGFADSFTDTIQDLAMQTACIGQYSATQAGGGWYDDPHDYYTPQMMAERFAKMSGNMTRTTTFYGVCFDYAQFAYQDIERYKSWYNQQGMYEGQFWLAGVHGDSSTIILSMPTTRENATTTQNGVYIKTFGDKSNRAVKTHRLKNEGTRATHHAWIWIQRADGVWFWIDPTWTDNLGYVVYGYVKNGEEVQCRPDKNYCIEYPAYLNNLPSPPAMGQRIAPSKTANSTNREETINDAGAEWVTKIFNKTFVDVDYGDMDEYNAMMLSVDVPYTVITDRVIQADKFGFSLDTPLLTEIAAMLVGFAYLHNAENENNLHAVLVEIAPARRLFNNLAWYIGGGIGLRLDVSNKDGAF